MKDAQKKVLIKVLRYFENSKHLSKETKERAIKIRKKLEDEIKQRT